MIKFLNSRNKKGFTLTEIMAGALIVTISAAGGYSVYIIARRFGDRFRHKTMATNRATQIADSLRYRHRLNGPALNIPPGSTTQHYDSTNDPGGLLDTSGWELNNEVNDLSAEYDVSYVWFINGIEQTTDPDNDGDGDPTTGTPPPFKKIVATIKWAERK